MWTGELSSDSSDDETTSGKKEDPKASSIRAGTDDEKILPSFASTFDELQMPKFISREQQIVLPTRSNPLETIANVSTIKSALSKSVAADETFEEKVEKQEYLIEMQRQTEALAKNQRSINKNKTLTNDTAKDKVKRQRLAGQSGIGEDFKSWKSEEEMRQRQHFD